MNYQNSKWLSNVQTHLKSRSGEIYLAMLANVLRVHKKYSFTKPLHDALRRADFGELYRLSDSLSTQQYVDATQHFVANQIALLIKKYPWPKDQLDLKPRERATESFHAAEKRCGLINRKFTVLNSDRSRDRFGKEAGVARYWIRSVIGSYPGYRAIFSEADFGPGASVGVHGDATGYSAKILAEHWTVTPGALHHGYAAVRRNHHVWESLLERKGPFVCYDEVRAFEAYIAKIQIVKNNKISFVPKTAKTDRTIAVEPLLNGLVQKGIDTVLRKKLRKVGIDLTDQGTNQRMAREGSLDDSDNGFVTIDLKSASDSISVAIIRYLFPEDWFEILRKTRSEYYELDGVVRRYHKFCSMGNGFCFPVETLLFAAACKAVGAGVAGVDFTVYGDDIIVRKRYALQVLSLLKHWGFKVNTDKTFLSGPFRESCGADWFGGWDVRPFTLDYRLDSLQGCFKFLNLSRRSTRTILFFDSIRDYVVRRIPEPFRFYRPFAGEAESGIDSQGAEFMTASSCRFRNGRWIWHELAVIPVIDWNTVRAAGGEPWFISEALRGASSVRDKNHMLQFLPKVTLRNRTQTKVVRKGYVSTSNWLPTAYARS